MAITQSPFNIREPGRFQKQIQEVGDILALKEWSWWGFTILPLSQGVKETVFGGIVLSLPFMWYSCFKLVCYKIPY